MRSLFAPPQDGPGAPATATAATGWNALGRNVKVAAGLAVVAGLVALVVLPGLGDNKAVQTAAPPPQQAATINEYAAPVAQGPLDQAANSVAGNSFTKTPTRRVAPTEMALYVAPPAVLAPGTTTRANGQSLEDGAGGRAGTDPEDRLASTLNGATMLPASHAVLVRHADYTIRPGDPIQCIPQDAMNSGLPGFTRCRIPEWTRGHSQTRGLIPPGSVIFGQIRQGVAQGQQRLGVLYTSIEGPRFKVLLSAPGGDAMGRAGLEGDVNTFFWDKAGAVALYSLLDVAIGTGQNLASSSLSRAIGGGQGGGSTLNFGGQAQGLASQEMASRTNRPPVITRDQGLPILVTVGQDLEFYDICMKLRVSDPMACPLL